MRKLCIALLFALAPVFVFAETQSPAPNVAVVPVVDRSAKALDSGLRDAFKLALTTVSGNPTLNTTAIISQVKDITEFVQSYSYELAQNTEAASKPGWLLEVTFDKKALQQLIKKAPKSEPQASVEPQLMLSPMALAWVNVEDDVLSSSNNSPLAQALLRQAQQQNVSLILPAMDLQDQAAVGAAARAEFDLAALKTVASRYAVKNMIIGHVMDEGGQWRGQWLFTAGDESVQWMNQADSAEVLLSQAVTKFAELNQPHAISSEHERLNYTVEIFGIGDLNEYVKVMHMLQSLPEVSAVSVKDMASNSLLLAVTSKRSREDLMSSLRANPHFREMIAANVSGIAQADLYLQWLTPGAVQNTANAPDNTRLMQDAGLLPAAATSPQEQPDAATPTTDAHPDSDSVPADTDPMDPDATPDIDPDDDAPSD